MGLVYTALGLAGEVGELCSKIKDILDNDSGADGAGVEFYYFRDSLKGELGDVLWYIANLSKELGFDLSEIAEENIEKLSSRQERGVISGDGDNR